MKSRKALWCLLWLLPGAAAAHEVTAGLQRYDTGYTFPVLEERLIRAVADNDMGLVAHASASRGARTRGVTIPGNAVLGVFRNDFAVRMLEASVAAGIEAPLRFYVTENADGTATLSYRIPSSVFAPYANPELDRLAGELDTVFARIAADAVGR